LFLFLNVLRGAADLPAPDPTCHGARPNARQDLKKKLSGLQVPTQEFQRSWPGSLIRMAAITLLRIIHKSVAGIRIRMKLMGLVMSSQLGVELGHVLR
jgi:hypothetical protein